MHRNGSGENMPKSRERSEERMATNRKKPKDGHEHMASNGRCKIDRYGQSATQQYHTRNSRAHCSISRAEQHQSTDGNENELKMKYGKKTVKYKGIKCKSG